MHMHMCLDTISQYKHWNIHIHTYDDIIKIQKKKTKKQKKQREYLKNPYGTHLFCLPKLYSCTVTYKHTYSYTYECMPAIVFAFVFVT